MSSKIIQVCSGRACTERHSKYIGTRLSGDIYFYGYSGVEISTCLCQGRCKEWPTVVYDGVVETRMNPIKASEYLRKKISQWRGERKKEVVDTVNAG